MDFYLEDDMTDDTSEAGRLSVELGTYLASRGFVPDERSRELQRRIAAARDPR
jgi:hypothetical protein